MALSKTTVVDKIEVLEKGQVQVRTKTTVLEDSVALSSSFHRHAIMPRLRTGRVVADDGSVTAAGTWNDTDISGEAANVQAVATAAWTDAVKDAYEALIESED